MNYNCTNKLQPGQGISHHILRPLYVTDFQAVMFSPPHEVLVRIVHPTRVLSKFGGNLTWRLFNSILLDKSVPGGWRWHRPLSGRGLGTE